MERDLIHFAHTLYSVLTGIHAESHEEKNRRKTVVYPYLTYTFNAERLQPPQDGFYLDLDLFDNTSDKTNIFQLETMIINGLDKLRFHSEGVHFRFTYNRSVNQRTGLDTLSRRSMQFYIKTDWS